MYQAKRPIAIHPGEILREEFMVRPSKPAARLYRPLARAQFHAIHARRGSVRNLV